jgi:hypothetical protein
MQDDPIRYLKDLAHTYRQMSDRELLDLAGKPEDLTEAAQQALSEEMKLRRLGSRKPWPEAEEAPPVPMENFHRAGVSRDASIGSEPEDPNLGGEDEAATEYTWKTLLCDCVSNDQAGQLREALRRRGIESWAGEVSATSRRVIGPRVFVAADQLEEARAVAERPIPRDIVEDWNTPAPEFELPKCPRCGKNDSVMLVGTDPANTWYCEDCDAEWAEPQPADDDTERGESFTS